jgi:hypothetical protein
LEETKGDKKESQCEDVVVNHKKPRAGKEKGGME